MKRTNEQSIRQGITTSNKIQKRKGKDNKNKMRQGLYIDVEAESEKQTLNGTRKTLTRKKEILW